MIQGVNLRALGQLLVPETGGFGFPTEKCSLRCYVCPASIRSFGYIFGDINNVINHPRRHFPTCARSPRELRSICKCAYFPSFPSPTFSTPCRNASQERRIFPRPSLFRLESIDNAPRECPFRGLLGDTTRCRLSYRCVFFVFSALIVGESLETTSKVQPPTQQRRQSPTPTAT